MSDAGLLPNAEILERVSDVTIGLLIERFELHETNVASAYRDACRLLGHANAPVDTRAANEARDRVRELLARVAALIPKGNDGTAPKIRGSGVVGG